MLAVKKEVNRRNPSGFTISRLFSFAFTPVAPPLWLVEQLKARPHIHVESCRRRAFLSLCLLRNATPLSSKQDSKMSTTKIVSYRIMGKLITFSITENKDTNQFTARIQSGGEIVAVIEGDKIKNAFENVKKRLPKFFEEERAINNIGKQFS